MGVFRPGLDDEACAAHQGVRQDLPLHTLNNSDILLFE
jgi:hypothetical protein